jgi:hypothetical protein
VCIECTQPLITNNPQGQAVGIYVDTSFNLHGFVLSAGTFTSIDFPGASITFLTGINSEGQAVGFYATPTTPLRHLLPQVERQYNVRERSEEKDPRDSLHVSGPFMHPNPRTLRTSVRQQPSEA